MEECLRPCSWRQHRPSSRGTRVHRGVEGCGLWPPPRGSFSLQRRSAALLARHSCSACCHGNVESRDRNKMADGKCSLQCSLLCFWLVRLYSSFICRSLTRVMCKTLFSLLLRRHSALPLRLLRLRYHTPTEVCRMPRPRPVPPGGCLYVYQPAV